MKTNRMIIGSVASLSLLAGACGVTDVTCTTEARPAIQVEIADSITRQPVAALVWVREGSFVDTLATNSVLASGPAERAGVYDVHVEHPDYQPWVRANVTVTADQCHVRTRNLVAYLQP